MKHRCPIHNEILVMSPTAYGARYDCPEPHCSVMCWGGETSTPADKETRETRHAAHVLFDKLPMRKAQRYKWLRDQMNLSPQKAHIGMFDLEQCEKLIQLCTEYQPCLSKKT